jgi:hypothetical protein
VFGRASRLRPTRENRQQATGNRQQAIGNRQSATGNRQSAIGNRQQEKDSVHVDAFFLKRDGG